MDDQPTVEQAKSNCTACREALRGDHVEAGNGHKYHADCFRCHQCLQSFRDGVFFESPNGLYCEDDFALLERNRCYKCCEVIEGKCLSALDVKWHLDHFNCTNCGRSLVGAAFVKKDEHPYCKLCPTDAEKITIKRMDESALLCAVCGKPIVAFALVVLGKRVHAHHYHCLYCQRQLDHTAREFDGKLYCFADYEKITSKVCFACKKPILGTSVSALGKVFHIEHFVCFKCEGPFNGSAYFEHEGKPYCEPHYKQMTGSICQYCRKVVKGSAIIEALGGKWCDAHFQCLGCFVNLSDLKRTSFLDVDCKPYCRRCFDRIPGEVRRAMVKYRDKEKQYV